jgi:hypothetical protein
MNQKWRIIYVDKMKPEPKKGQLNTEFGLYVERPFHIVSQLPSHKFLDVLGSNLVIKTPNGRKSQIWWFDQKSKTIKSQWRRHQSIDMQNAGRSRNLQIANTNSGWF